MSNSKRTTMDRISLNDCKFQIAQIEYQCGLSYIDERGQTFCIKDKNGNYLDMCGKIIDIDKIDWFNGETVKQALDFWNQQLNILLNK